MGGTTKNAPAAGTTAFEGMAHMGTTFCGNGIAVCCGIVVVGLLGLFEVVSPAVIETAPSFMSTYALFTGRLRFFFSGGSPGSGSEFLLLLLVVEEGEVVGIFRVPLTDIAMAGTVPVPVAAMIAGSACSRSHRMVSPSDLCPSSRVS